jgi:hypothetical protein
MPHRPYPTVRHGIDHHIDMPYQQHSINQSLNHRKTMSQKEIVDAVLHLRDDHRVADIWHSADTIAACHGR